MWYNGRDERGRKAMDKIEIIPGQTDRAIAIMGETEIGRAHV